MSQVQGQERIHRRGTLIRREHDRVQDLYALQSGWLLSFILLDDGSRQILRIHLPGDIIGLSSIAYPQATESLLAVTDVRLGILDRNVLKTIFTDHPRLGALLFTIAQAEQVSMGDRLASLGRTSAKGRVAALLMDTVVRLRLIKSDIGSSFAFPLTQEEIGDATGLTAVHVNRMIRALVEDGLIARNANQLTILDEKRLSDVANYVNRYAKLDTAWFPPPR